MHAAGYPDVRNGIDVVLTGILIGLGPGPLHALLGILVELRNAVAGVADIARGTALKKAAETLRDAVTVSNDGRESGDPDARAQVSRSLAAIERATRRLLRP